MKGGNSHEQIMSDSTKLLMDLWLVRSVLRILCHKTGITYVKEKYLYVRYSESLLHWQTYNLSVIVTFHKQKKMARLLIALSIFLMLQVIVGKFFWVQYNDN